MQMAGNRIYLAKRGTDSIIHKLKQYIDPIDNTWFDKLKPASEKQIIELKQRLNLSNLHLELPEAYVEFLRYAGENAGGLFDALRAEMSISSLLSKKKVEVYMNEADSMRPYCFEFLRDDIGLGYSLNLCEDNQKIIMEESYEISDNFENLLFQCAVNTYENKYFQFSQCFSASINGFRSSEIGKADRDLFDYVHKVAEQYHLQEAWFSDICFHFSYSEELSLMMNRSGGPFRGRICFNDIQMAIALNKTLLSKIGAKTNEIEEISGEGG